MKSMRTRSAMGWLAAIAMLAVVAMPASAAEPNPEDAQALLVEVSEEVLAVLDEHAAGGDMDVEQVRAELSDIIAPHMDFITMTRLAVGGNWREADREQKRALVTEFRTLLVRTYSRSLDEYSGQQVEFLPLGESSQEDRVTVRSRVTRPDGPAIPVEYGVRYNDGEWKVYDVVVEGISLVTTYRSNFSSIVRSGGIEGLVEELKRKNETGETSPEAPGADS
ncbi:MAG: ABC transporter substrate-binding protein [Halofilum sp. (in: g-proteobacteria)]